MSTPVDERLVTIFGGSGFLGRRIAERVLLQGRSVRVVSRNPTAAAARQPPNLRSFSTMKADILDKNEVVAAVAGSGTVINAVSLYSEHGSVTFDRVHVQAAFQLAAAARDAGVERFIQISGIGADARSRSNYISARGRGEEAVKGVFPDAVIVRPAVMTGSDDAFMTTIVKLVRILPTYPLFGNGDTRLQPAYVEDVAEAVARIASAVATDHLFEFGGPSIYSYRDLVLYVARLLNMKVRLVPIPFAAWRMLAAVAELIPGVPLARNQIDLMQIDNVVHERSGFSALGMEPQDIDVVVGQIEETK